MNGGKEFRVQKICLKGVEQTQKAFVAVNCINQILFAFYYTCKKNYFHLSKFVKCNIKQFTKILYYRVDTIFIESTKYLFLIFFGFIAPVVQRISK